MAMHEAGIDDAGLARQLDVDPVAVPALLELARAKLTPDRKRGPVRVSGGRHQP